jgi:hypothetical protein
MSGRLRDKLSRFLRMSTSSPWRLEPCYVFFFMPRQVFRCLFISEARMFCRQTWHCCRIERTLTGSLMIFSSKLLGFMAACFCILAKSYPPVKFLLASSSKLIVSTSSKSFQSMVLSLVGLACSFLPLVCCCLAIWYSKIPRHFYNIWSCCLA